MSFRNVKRYLGEDGYEDESEYYVFIRTRKFPKRLASRIGKALWTEDEGEIYITCAECGAINSLQGFSIFERDGYCRDTVYPCIHCRKCDSAFWAHLRGWRKVPEKIRRRRSDPEHWDG